MTFDWYWLVVSFWLGGLSAVVLLALILMAGRDMYPPPERRRDDDDLLRDLPPREDGTRAARTVTGYDVPDTDTAAQAWPLDRDHVRYIRR